MTTDPDPDLTAAAAAGPVSRGQVLDALDDVAWHGLPERWRGVLIRARSLAVDLAGLDVALAAIDDLHTPVDRTAPAAQRDRHLDPEKVPASRTATGSQRPGMLVAVSNAAGLLRAEWTTRLYRYVALAQAALEALASDDPDAQFSDGGRGDGFGAHLVNELTAPPSVLEMQLQPAPRPALPTQLVIGDPAWLRVEAAMARVNAAEAAAGEYEDLTTYEDSDTGELRFSLAEHQFDTAAELEDEAEDWPHAVSQFADTVVYVLATHPGLITELHQRVPQPEA